MSIEEKLSTVAENTPKVYNQGYEDGKNSVNNPLEYAFVMANVYAGVTFPDGYELTLNIPNVSELKYTFNNTTGMEKLVIKGNNNGNILDMYSAFRIKTIKTIDLTEFNAKIGNGLMTFYYTDKLYEVLGELDFTECTTTSSMWSGCRNLVTVTPKANTIKISISFADSPKLSDTSIQSIIDGLADLTGGTAQTLTLHKDVGAKLTDAQKATITAKNWTLVY